MVAHEQLKAEEAGPTYIMTEDRPINEVQSGGKIFEEGCQKMTMAMDSGAAERIILQILVMGHLIMETEASKSCVK